MHKSERPWQRFLGSLLLEQQLICCSQMQVFSCLKSIEKKAKALWPHSQTRMFGSQAAGLAMAGADLDVVVLNVVSGPIEGGCEKSIFFEGATDRP